MKIVINALVYCSIPSIPIAKEFLTNNYRKKKVSSSQLEHSAKNYIKLEIIFS